MARRVAFFPTDGRRDVLRAITQTVHDGFHFKDEPERTHICIVHSRNLERNYVNEVDAKTGSGRCVFGVVIQIGTVWCAVRRTDDATTYTQFIL